MRDAFQNKILSPGLLKDINEPIISSNNAVFIQNSSNSSKITVYNIKTCKARSINMKNIWCFNAHSYGNYVIFEFSGERRGIGILSVETLSVKEIDYSGIDMVLGGMWENYVVLRRNYDIVLRDIESNKETIIASCRHIIGVPTIGYGHCAWLKLYKDKCCIVLYDIAKGSSLIMTSSGYINKIYLIGGHVVYQNCSDNKCSIYVYNIQTGVLKKCFESRNWIELYIGRNDTLVWTLRKEYQGRYLFDIFVYNIYNNKMAKMVSDYSNTVIPTVSNELLVFIDGNMKGDSAYLMRIDMKYE